MAAVCSSTRTTDGGTTAQCQSIRPTTAPSGTRRSTTRLLEASTGQHGSGRSSSIAARDKANSKSLRTRPAAVGGLFCWQPLFQARDCGDDREPNMTKVLLSWSSGKDSAWALHLLRQRPDIQVAALVTTFNSEANRVAMHAVRRSLVEAQAERTGLPLWKVELPWPCSNEEYEQRMRAVCERATADGINAIAFGDLFLQDIRDYRVRELQGSGLTPLFPVWQIPTER